MKTTFGVIEAPVDLVLKPQETIEWYVKYRKPDEFRDNSFLIHANTSDSAYKGVQELFPTARILKVEYIGTYQY